MILVLVLISIFLVIIAGVYAGSETAMYSINLFDHEMTRTDKKTSIIKGFLNNIEQNITYCLIGQNVSFHLITYIVTYILIFYGIQNSDFYTTLILTPILFIFSETIPKSIYRNNPISSLRFTHKLLNWSRYPFYLPSRALLYTSYVFNKKILKYYKNEDKQDSIKSMQFIFEKGFEANLISADQKSFSHKIIDFKEYEVDKIMIPYSATVKLDSELYPRTALKEIKGKQYKRYPVVNTERILGIINIIDLVKHITEDIEVGEIYHKLLYFTSGESLDHVLLQMKKEKVKVGAIEENGKVLGFVFLKDIIELLFGSN